MFPLFDRASFNEKFNLQYSGNPPSGPAWYAALNIVLCIGCLLFQIRSQGPQNNTPEDPIWTRYFRNASSCFLDLLFEDGTLLAIQAIVGMVRDPPRRLGYELMFYHQAVVQQISLQPQAVYILTAAAGRLAYGIGLHRNLKDFGLSQAEITQRKNVFWIVYFIDKSVALRLGHPSVMNDDDIGIDLPQAETLLERQPGGSVKFGMFRYQAQLARLESRIHSELYSARAQNKPALDRLRAVGELDKALLEWKDALPEEIQPEKAITFDEDHVLPIVMMHFAYFNCLTTIHRVSIHHGSWTSSHLSQSGTLLHGQNLNPRVYASQSICIGAARQSIQLLQHVQLKAHSTSSSVIWFVSIFHFILPSTRSFSLPIMFYMRILIFHLMTFIILPVNDACTYSYFRMLMYYPLSGLLTLFANTLQNPQDPQVASDLKLMEIVISFFSEPVIHVSPITITTARIFEELVNVARKLVEKTSSHISKPAKRGHDEADPQQDVAQVLPTGSEPSRPFLEPNVKVELSGSLVRNRCAPLPVRLLL